MSRPRRSLTLVVTILLISSLAYQLMPSTLPSIPRVHATNRTILLNGNYPNWNSSNPTITVTQGDTITMMLSSIDNLPHRFLVDVDKDPNPTDVTDCPSVDPCSSQFGPTTPTTYTFTVNFPTGPYKYICTIHYPNMVGNFIVQSPPSPDFTINSNPTSLNIAQGSSGTATITLTSVNSYSNTITLTPTVSANGPQVSLSPTSVTLSSGSTASATLTAKTAASGLYSSPVSQGTYSVTVTGTDGTISRSTNLTITVSAGSTSPMGLGNLLTPLSIGVIAAAAVIVIAAAIYLLRRKPKTPA